MPGDFSRKTFRKEQHYNRVLQQQGRVQTDADWNEQVDIQLYRTETEATDVIGRAGVPKKDNGFEIGLASGGRDLTIAPGRIYVEGQLCELEAAARYTTQPYLPHPEFTSPSSPPSSPPHDTLSLPTGNYLVFLDAWKLEVSALDDKLIREVALGGPDTTRRSKNVWQVKLLRLSENSPPSGSPPDCKSSLAQFQQHTLAGDGKLNARAKPAKPEDNPCVLPAQAGYNLLENQLYRVEIQRGGPLNQATFKWSRDTVETSIKEISGSLLKVGDTGKDQVLGFAGGQWVEIVHDESTLKGPPNPLVQIDKIGPGPNEITLKTSVNQFKNFSGKKLRRWDQTGTSAQGVSATPGWIELEGGVQVEFSAGNYRAGDYWLIPARTATGEIEWPPFEIPNKNPIAQLPRGIRHHYCQLAVIRSVSGVITLIEDCRKLFPALTEICAEDICFDNDKCDFAGAETVQDALDKLCAARDLRFHNKHLHGWGIVCGLQVNCGPDPSNAIRRHVTVRPGYAIDCEGNDIVLHENRKIDLLAMLPQNPPTVLVPGGVKDGDVCLVLEGRDKDVRFAIAPKPQPKKNWEALLAGTLLADVLQDCIVSLIDFFKKEFTVPPGGEKGRVGPIQKRITAFSNLLIQLINRENGSFVFTSGEKGKTGENFEDTILRNFYHQLREKLQSHTFCAMFEGARPFPEYPYADLKIDSILGKGFQTRFRVSPKGKLGYSVGASNMINVYDLAKGEMVAEVEFPGGTSAIVQDVAFSQDGNQLFAVATLKNKDSMFATATVSGFKHTWNNPEMICDVLLLTLGTLSSSKKIFAVGKGKGLYEIDPQNVVAKPTPIYEFNAVGHMVIPEERFMAFATSSSQALPTDIYNRVEQLDLIAHDALFKSRSPALNFPGQDDIAVAVEQSQTRLYVVVNPATGKSTKQLLVFTQTFSTPTVKVEDLGEDTGIRVAYNPASKHVMVAYEDSYRIGLVNPDHKLVSNFRHPVQISPRSIAVSQDGKRVYVLNYGSNTINSIPAERLDPKNQIALQPLVDYRAAVINAFADLLGGLIQYLKDCFCDHFLVNCPTCDEEEDKLYLACITIKGGQVFKVCNFSLRKYVHSWPTVEYWLSVVPIIPLITRAVESFCCAALPGFFNRFSAPKPDVKEAKIRKNRLTSNQLGQGISYVQQADFRGAITRATTVTATGRKLLIDLGSEMASRALATREGVKPNDLEDTTSADATKKLEDANITVDKVEEYDPKKARNNLIRYAAAPPSLEPGMRVNLVTKDDKVLFYTLAGESSTPVAELRVEIEATRANVAQNKDALEKISPQVEELRTKVEAAAFANKAELDKISPQLQNLRSKVDTDSAVLAANKAALEKTLPQLETLKAEVTANRAALDKSSPQIAELSAKVDATNAAIAATKTSVADSAALREQVKALRAELVTTQKTHKDEMAARDKANADLKVNLDNAIKTIGTINERLKKLPPFG